MYVHWIVMQNVFLTMDCGWKKAWKIFHFEKHSFQYDFFFAKDSFLYPFHTSKFDVRVARWRQQVKLNFRFQKMNYYLVGVCPMWYLGKIYTENIHTFIWNSNLTRNPLFFFKSDSYIWYIMNCIHYYCNDLKTPVRAVQFSW